MNYTVLLNVGENTKQIEAEEQGRFVKIIMEEIGVPIDFDPEQEFTIEDKIKLRKDLSKFNIQIIDDLDGGLTIYAHNEKIAEFYKCKYKLKEDQTSLDPNKKLFLEMDINFWTQFENA